MLPGRTTPLRRGQKRSLRGGGEDHDQTLSTKPPTTPQLTPGAGLATCGPATGVASGDHTRPTSLAGGSWPAPPAPPRPASSRPDGSTAPCNAPRPQRRERGPAVGFRREPSKRSAESRRWTSETAADTLRLWTLHLSPARTPRLLQRQQQLDSQTRGAPPPG